MKLVDELEAVGSVNKSKIDQIIDGTLTPKDGREGLSELDRAELHDLVLNPKFGTAAITQALIRRGYEIGESSIRRYRQKHGL